ncbi:MAG TPA: alpha/beta hydrolase, partial [Pseudolabrys sp.]|nr:alpha/beta hydrolase [Pseudolabrys sp.]
MPHLTTDDGIKLFYEEVGSGIPVVFVHEFAGDRRSHELQMRYFGQRYRCIAYNARGYPPSDVPADGERYSQERARDDIRAVLDALKIDKAHIVGLSMGGFATLHFGLRHPAMARSLTICGCGYGAKPETRDIFRKESEELAALFDREGSAKATARYAAGSARVQLQNKNPRGWQVFADRLAKHSAKGSANTLRGVQASRPSLYDLADEMKK